MKFDVLIVGTKHSKDYVQGKALVLGGVVIDKALLANADIPLKELVSA